MVRFLVRISFCAALVLVTAGASLLAQSGAIRGTVADTAGNPVSNATVVVDGTGLRISTAASGSYEIRGVPAGTYTVRARAIGFQSSGVQVTVAASDVIEQHFVLERSTVQLAPIDVVVGSRAVHSAEEELAVPVDIYPAEVLQQQGSTETSVILQSVSPSINFPRQSVTDAGDIIRPFTLRGLSPDHTLVLMNGWRRHQTAVVNNFTYGMGAGSSGVDLNTFPASALERIEVLRDGASAQYGSDAIAGVVNLVLKDGAFTPFVNADAGRYTPDDYVDDGTTVNVNGGWGIGLGRGSLGLFGEFRDRQETNRAWADPSEDAGTGVFDVVNEKGQVVQKNNPVPQPNHHWGDGLEKDVLTFGNFRMPVNAAGSSEVYAFGGYSHRDGSGNAYRRYAGNGRNWREIYPLGFLPTFSGVATDWSGVGGLRGVVSGWNYDIGAEFGHNGFDYDMTTTLNPSLGPCLDPENPCAPGPDRVLGTADDPGIPNQTEFFAGNVEREEVVAAVNIAKAVDLGLRGPVNLAFGAAFRRERYAITAGETASWINGFHLDQDSLEAVPGSSGFAGFAPSDETDQHRNNFGLYADAETDLSDQVLVNVATRFETYSDFGERLTGKAAVRYQPSRRVTLRAAVGTGFRAPGLSQVGFSKVVTNVIGGEFVEVGIFPSDHPAALALGAVPLEEEKSVNFSAGVAFSPTDNVLLTADYFHIDIDDRTLLGATFDDDATLQILADAGFGTLGAVQYFTNGLDTRTQGIDLTGNVRVPAGTGTLDLNASVNYTKNEILRVDPLPQVLVDAGSTEPGLLDSVTVIGIEEERPDWRATLQANYGVGRFSALGRYSYYGGFASAQPGFCDLCREDYGGKGLFDAEIGYRFNLVKLAVGARNIFDTYPDQPSSTRDTGLGGTSQEFNNNFGTFPWAAASPFGYNGRFVYARTEIQLAW